MKYVNPSNFRKAIKAKAFSNFLNLSSVQFSNTLLSFLIYPIILRKVGLEASGLVITSSYFAVLVGTLVNYGTSQSGVRDIVVNKDDQAALSAAFYNTILIRFLIFIIFIITFALLGFGHLPNYGFFLFSIPLVFAEVLNPMFLYLGKEDLVLYNVGSFLSKLLIILGIFFLINKPEEAEWINFIIGAVNCLFYVFLVIRAMLIYKLKPGPVRKTALIHLGINNFYLVGNNISVNLQQSLMIFSINLWGNPMWLGAYAICDKIIGAAKTLVISVFNSIYPKFAQLFKEDPGQFESFKNRSKLVLFFVFLAGSLVVMQFSDLIIRLINGSPNKAAASLLRIMAFLPPLAAINSINVLEFLIRDMNIFIFRIAMVLLFCSALLAGSIVYLDNLYFFGSYLLIIESLAILMYEFTIRNKRTSNNI